MILASLPHYSDHLAPIAALLPDDDQMALVASHADSVRAKRKRIPRIVLAQHGAGQSYSDHHPCYAGGSKNDHVSLFLTPNEHSAQRWRSAYPSARVEVVGCPRLDSLPARVGSGPPVIAISTHWDGRHVPEARSAWPWLVRSLPALAERYELIGHCHPKRNDIPRWYRSHGIEYVPTFDEVCRRADLYICDNSSTLFEFASTGRPVVVIDAPSYRPEATHGLRFWDAADVGVRIPATGDLIEAVAHALADPPDVAARREAALDIVYAYRTGAGPRAAEAIQDWAA